MLSAAIHPSIQSFIPTFMFISFHSIPYHITSTNTNIHKINLQQLFPVVLKFFGCFFNFRSPGSVLVWAPRFPWETAQSLDPSTNVRWKLQSIRSSIESCRSCQRPKFQCLGSSWKKLRVPFLLEFHLQIVFGGYFVHNICVQLNVDIK